MSAGRRKSWAWGLAALSLVACGGRSTQEPGDPNSTTTAGGANSGGAPGNGPEGPLPPRGFYRKSVMTTSDTCTWTNTAAGDISLVGVSSKGVVAQLGPGNLQHEVPWQGLAVALPPCNTALMVEALSRDTTSFVLDVTEAWPAPEKCGFPPEQVPAAACSGEWIETFRLLEACPTTVGQESCN